MVRDQMSNKRTPPHSTSIQVELTVRAHKLRKKTSHSEDASESTLCGIEEKIGMMQNRNFLENLSSRGPSTINVLKLNSNTDDIQSMITTYDLYLNSKCSSKSRENQNYDVGIKESASRQTQKTVISKDWITRYEEVL